MRIMGRGHYYANEGIFDSRLEEDINSNNLGIEFALAKSNLARQRLDPQSTIIQLNDPRFARTGNGRQHLVPIGAAA
jgi:hypothetical protein